MITRTKAKIPLFIQYISYTPSFLKLENGCPSFPVSQQLKKNKHSFSKYVNQLIYSLYEQSTETSRPLLFFDKVIVYFNMLGLIMLDGVMCCTFVGANLIT